MPELVFSLDRPTPNVALERLRQAFLSTDDLYVLVDVVLELVDGALTAAADATSERDLLRADLDALTARVADLEPPFVPTDPEEPVP